MNEKKINTCSTNFMDAGIILDCLFLPFYEPSVPFDAFLLTKWGTIKKTKSWKWKQRQSLTSLWNEHFDEICCFASKLQTPHWLKCQWVCCMKSPNFHRLWLDTRFLCEGWRISLSFRIDFVTCQWCDPLMWHSSNHFHFLHQSFPIGVASMMSWWV